MDNSQDLNMVTAQQIRVMDADQARIFIMGLVKHQRNQLQLINVAGPIFCRNWSGMLACKGIDKIDWQYGRFVLRMEDLQKEQMV